MPIGDSLSLIAWGVQDGWREKENCMQNQREVVERDKRPVPLGAGRMRSTG